MTAIAAAAFAMAAAASDSAEKVYAVRTAHTVRRTIAQSLVKTGSLSAPAEVALCPKVAGRLASTSLADGAQVEEGTRARAGEILARIDDREYRIALDSARASVAAAEATAEDAGREFARVERLRKSNVASEQDFDAARFARDHAAAALEKARAELAAAELNMGETSVRAPFDGVVAAKRLHPGAMVSPSSEIYSFVATDPIRVLFQLPTTAVPNLIPKKTRVDVKVDAYPGEKVPLTVAEVFPTADAATRTVTVLALLPNAAGRYRPGMFARGAFALDEREGALTIPYESLLRIKDRYCVYRVVDGRARLTEVKPGLRHDAFVEIAEGLGDGDEIVTDGIHRLSDGVAVKVVDGGGTASAEGGQ